MKKQDESKNEFRCVVCDKMRLRGVFIKAIKGKNKGLEVKTCQSSKCVESAKVGIYAK